MDGRSKKEGRTCTGGVQQVKRRKKEQNAEGIADRSIQILFPYLLCPSDSTHTH